MVASKRKSKKLEIKPIPPREIYIAPEEEKFLKLCDGAGYGCRTRFPEDYDIYCAHCLGTGKIMTPFGQALLEFVKDNMVLNITQTIV